MNNLLRIILSAAAGFIFVSFPITAQQPAAADAAAFAPPSATQDLQTFCQALYVHEGVGYKNLMIFPVTIRTVRDNTAYTSLDEAIESGLVKITEVGSGSVPTLKLEINSTQPFFFMAGEVVTGAKQDRILTHDLLFKGFKGSIDLPVYCVEQGRWTPMSDQFQSGKILGSSALRKSAVMKEGQQTAWAEVQQKNAEMDASSSTDTFQATYQSEKYQQAESEYLDKLRGISSMYGGEVCGVVVAIGGEVVSADLFANNQTFSKLWPKVLKAAITDAVTAAESTVSDNTAAREFIGAALKASINNQDNPSQGQEFSLKSEKIQGSFILTANGITHLALFTGKLKSTTPRETQEQVPQVQQQQRFDNSAPEPLQEPTAR
jgi:hypothetical protein